MKASAICRIGFALSALLAATSSSIAQTNFPSRAIRVIVTIQGGTGSDSVARFFCAQLSEVLGQPCTVENRPGANSVIGTVAVKQAPADGYTIIMGSNSPMAVNVALLKDLPYDPVKDFKPIYGLARHTNVIMVAESSGIKSVPDLVAAAKKRQLNAGAYASLYELATHWFSTTTGANLLVVGYKGLPQLTVDLMSREVDFAIVDLAGIAPQFTSKKLRPIAVLGDRPHPNFPDVPPVKDSGYPEFVNYSWTAFYVRSETPEDATAKLVEAMRKVVEMPAAREFVSKLNLELMSLPPAQMRKFQIEEIDRFKRIAAAANIGAK